MRKNQSLFGKGLISLTLFFISNQIKCCYHISQSICGKCLLEPFLFLELTLELYFYLSRSTFFVVVLDLLIGVLYDFNIFAVISRLEFMVRACPRLSLLGEISEVSCPRKFLRKPIVSSVMLRIPDFTTEPRFLLNALYVTE